MAAAAIAPMVVTLLAAAMVRRQRRIVEQLRSAGATSPDRATPAATFGGDEGMAFGILLRHAVVKKTGERYYLDEPAWEAHRARRHRRVLIALTIALVGVAILWILLR